MEAGASDLFSLPAAPVPLPPIAEPAEEVLDQGYILDLPDTGSSAPAADSEATPSPQPQSQAARKPEQGALAPNRVWGNMPLTVDHAIGVEERAGARTGTYYVASASEKLHELSDMHSKWFTKSKNRRSSYCEVQQRVGSFYDFCKEEFNRRFPEYLDQPGFSELGKRKRQRTGKK